MLLFIVIGLVWAASFTSSPSPRPHFLILRVEGEEPTDPGTRPPSDSVSRRKSSGGGSSEEPSSLISNLKALRLPTTSEEGNGGGSSSGSNSGPYGQVQPKLTKLIIRHSRKPAPAPSGDKIGEDGRQLSNPSLDDGSDSDGGQSPRSSHSSQEPSPRTPRTPRQGEEVEYLGNVSSHARATLLLRDRSNCHAYVDGSGVIFIGKPDGRGAIFMSVRLPSVTSQNHSPVTPRRRGSIPPEPVRRGSNPPEREREAEPSSPVSSGSAPSSASSTSSLPPSLNSSPRHAPLETVLAAISELSDEAVLGLLQTRYSIKISLVVGCLIQLYQPRVPFERQTPAQRRLFLETMAQARDQGRLPVNLVEDHPGYLVEATLVSPQPSSAPQQDSPSTLRRLPPNPRRVRHTIPSSDITIQPESSHSEPSDEISLGNSNLNTMSVSAPSTGSPSQRSPVIPRVVYKRNVNFQRHSEVDTPRPNSNSSHSNSADGGSGDRSY